MADDVFHATFTRNLPDIQERGLDPLSESLWLNQGTGERYQQEPSVYSFSDPGDALRWASKMRYAFGDESSSPADVSIVRLRGGEHWHQDPSEDVNLVGGSSRRSLQSIAPQDVLEVISVPEPAGINEEFQRAVPGGGFDEWIQYYGNRIKEPRPTEQEPTGIATLEPGQTDKPTGLLNLYHATPVEGPIDFSIGELGAHFAKNPDISRRAMTLSQNENYRILEATVDLGNVVTVPEQESFFNAEDLVESLVDQGSISPEQASEAYDSIDRLEEDTDHPAMARARQVLDEAHIYDSASLTKQAETELLRPFLKQWGIDTIRYWNTYDAYGELGRLKNLPGVKEELELGTQPAWSYIVVDPERVRSVTEYKPGLPAPRPTDLVPVATDLVPLVVPPKEDPSQKKPKQTGKIWRGIGSMMRRRLVPIAQAAQLGWSALSDEQKGQVTEFLNNPIDFGLGRSEHPPGFKGGLDYFRQMLGMGPEQGGIASLPDLREPAPVYYSAVARAVDALPMERGAGEQMLAMISKSRGVKLEEMQWMDLPEFLRDKKSVTKQEIQDFVGANQLDIKEVVRSEGAMTDAFESSFAEGSIADELQGTALELVRDRQPLFEQYTLPGGKNYREVAFTLPGIAENFPGGHLKIPNTLAHVRLNDRTGPNGEKILFVEEIQSDWHKKGRTEGYKTSEFTNHNADIDGQVDDLMQRRTGINADLSENFNLGGTVLPDGNGVLWYSRDIIENNDFKNIGRVYENGSFYIDEGFSEANPAAAAKLKELAEIAAEVGNLYQSKRTGSMVPDAPLKKTWYEMVFRRIARMAAEGGYDSVAWTPGEVQAERYNLSKEVSTIEVTPMPDGTFKISPMLIDDDVPRVLHVEADQLDYTLGAELADKVRQQEERVAALGVEGLTRVYEGIDLKIGGEKLKGLYDGRIKNYASEFGKKFGARVGTTEINPYDDVRLPTSAAWDEHWRNLTQDRRDELVEQYRRRFEGTKVWNLPITPEMKEELLTQGIQKFAHGGFIDKPFYDRAV